MRVRVVWSGTGRSECECGRAGRDDGSAGGAGQEGTIRVRVGRDRKGRSECGWGGTGRDDQSEGGAGQEWMIRVRVGRAGRADQSTGASAQAHTDTQTRTHVSMMDTFQNIFAPNQVETTRNNEYFHV